MLLISCLLILGQRPVMQACKELPDAAWAPWSTPQLLTLENYTDPFSTMPGAILNNEIIPLKHKKMKNVVLNTL